MHYVSKRYLYNFFPYGTELNNYKFNILTLQTILYDVII